MSNQVHVNDIGTEFRIQIVDDETIVDLSTASILNILFRKPSGLLLTVGAELYTDGTDGIIYYNAVSGDLDEAGIYKIQGYVEIGSGAFYSSIGSFKVHCNV
jgi:hypothetical protein